MKYTDFETVTKIIEQNENVTLFENDGEKRFFDTDGHYYVLNFATEDGKEKNFYVSCDDFSLNVEEYIDASDEELCEKIDNGEYLPYSADYSTKLWAENLKKHKDKYLGDLYQYEDKKIADIKSSFDAQISEKTKIRDEIGQKIASLRLQGVPSTELNEFLVAKDIICREIVELRSQRSVAVFDRENMLTSTIYSVLNNTTNTINTENTENTENQLEI